MPHVSVRMDDELHRRLCQQAEAEDRSLSWVVCRAVRTELDRMTTGGPREYVASDPAEERARASKIRGARHAVEIVDEVRGPQVEPNFKGGKR